MDLRLVLRTLQLSRDKDAFVNRIQAPNPVNGSFECLAADSNSLWHGLLPYLGSAILGLLESFVAIISPYWPLQATEHVSSNAPKSTQRKNTKLQEHKRN